MGNGKNSKFLYYTKNGIRMLIPDAALQFNSHKISREIMKRNDRESIFERVDYYNKLNKPVQLPNNAPPLSALKLKNSLSVYYFDSFEYIRRFNNKLKWKYEFGDVTHIPASPSIVKSRPVKGDNANSVLLKLDKVRHFVFLNDRIPFSKKLDRSIFRGDIRCKPQRIKFTEMYFGHPLCDAGSVLPGSDHPVEWVRKKISLYDHLKYKFVIALEGNDVASNLKWIMSSGSVAVMPRPVYETWFMEGTLVPNVHYIEIKDDFSDLEEKLSYYIDHPHEAEEIARNANKYVQQFKDAKREDLISMLVLEKYFRITGQT